jgi:hypothetical protein
MGPVAMAVVASRKKTEPDEEHGVDMTVRKPYLPIEEAVAEEAREGCDLLFIGLEHTRSHSAHFHRDIMRVSSGWDGPLAIVEARGRHRNQPEQSGLNLLAPVNSTTMARRDAELAIAIARVVSAPVRATYVFASRGAEPQRPQAERPQPSVHSGVLRDIVELATTKTKKSAPSEAPKRRRKRLFFPRSLQDSDLSHRDGRCASGW